LDIQLPLKIWNKIMQTEHNNKSTIYNHPQNKPDYSLTGENSHRAVELGLAEADWYQSPVPRETMRKLLTRKNGPAIRDTLLAHFHSGRHSRCNNNPLGNLVGCNSLPDLRSLLWNQFGLQMA
jgi:hypothetical protein